MSPNYTRPSGRAIARATGAIWEGIKRLPATTAALTCTGVGIWYHSEFAAQFGEAAIALAVASDILKALAGPTLMAAVRAREFGRAGAAVIVLLVTLTFSLVAAFGSAQHRREATTDERTAGIGAYDDAAKRQRALDAELAQLGTPRPVDVIQAEVSAAKIDMKIWRRSNQCADISLDETRTACAPILALYKERGAAARKLEIEAELTQLRPTLAKGRPAHADPQAAAISAVSGIDEDTVRRMISALIVIAIEVGAIGGSIMAARPIQARTPLPDNDAGPKKPIRKHAPTPTTPRGTGRRKPGRPTDGRVIDFVERFRGKHGRTPSGTEIRSEFPDLPKSTAFDHAARARIIQAGRLSA